MTVNHPVKVGLLWHSLRSGNLGVGALTVSNMALLAEAIRTVGREPHFTILGAWDRHERYPLKFDYPVDECFFFSKSLLPGSDFRQALHDCDIVFDIGAGDSFADIYGLQRYIYLLLTKLAVRQPGRRLVFSPQTIGPFNTVFAKFTAPRIFSRARSVWARDGMSFEKLRSIAPAARAYRTTDVAFSLPFRRPDRAGVRAQSIVGLNVSALLFRESQEGNSNRFGLRENYSELIAGVLQNLSRRQDVSCCFIPHVIAPDNLGEDDYSLALELADKYRVAVSPRFASPIEAKSFIAGMDVLIGSRMHATIAALSAEIPIVPLGYSEKFSRIFSDLGYPLSLDLRTASIGDVLESLDRLLDRLDEYRSHAAAAARNADDSLKLYKAHLNELMMAFR